ncbi:MAG: YkgJ family cysteine cluster protein [Verrucomicrobiota bacterium]
MPRPSSRQPVPDEREEILAIYADLEARPLPRDCQMRTRCCHFRLAGHTPMLTLGEALYAARGVRASGRKALKAHPDGACPLLGSDGRCTIYQHRPFGCRTHFCQAAGGMYPRKHVADLIHRLESLDEKLGGDGARPLAGIIDEVLLKQPKKR